LLDANNIPYTYREYTRDPLSRDELLDVFKKLGVGPREVLRTRDANKAGIGPDVSDDALIDAMVDNPRLLQRPIGVLGDRAVVGRPAEQLLTIV
jgi:arsenate reductase